MTDRELLELAAKAVGLIVEWGIERKTLVVPYVDHPLNIYGYYWNPLTDDGDALRLAVKLGMGLNSSHPHTLIFSSADDVTENHGDDKYAATRRAIVRAAAEIAKAMP